MKARKGSIFTEVPAPKVPSNLFELSHEVKGSGKFGFLYPILCHECIPGDNMIDIPNIFARFAPMVAPPMHRVRVKVDGFFVANRLTIGTDLWDQFITGGQDGINEPVLPYVTVGAIAGAAANEAFIRKGSLLDYLGFPVLEGVAPVAYAAEQVSLIPPKAYLKIWNDYYRDPNLDNPYNDQSMGLNLTGSQDAYPILGDFFMLRVRGWERDAFTGILPTAQRGAEVLMPLTGNVDITYLSNSLVMKTTGAAPDAGPISTDGTPSMEDTNGNLLRVENIDEATVTNATSTINDFRMAYALQRWEEANARGGGRYIDVIESQFGERVPDYRMQRAEYCGGIRQDVKFSEVLATAESAEIPVGDMAGHGSVFASGKIKYHASEHGIFMVIMSFVPTPSYASQGLEKMWTRKSRYDYAWPLLANLGEEEVLSKQVFFDYASTGDAANQLLFGYNPRFWDMKYIQDRLCGDFRDDLLFWTLSRKFTERPALDANFVAMHEDTTAEETYRRIFAVQDGTDYIWFQIFHRFTARRRLPYFGVPKLNG